MAYPLGAYGYSIAVWTVSVMISVSGIALGLGYALNSKRLKEFGKGELLQSIINGALVGSLMAVFAANGIASQLIASMAMANNTSISCTGALATNPAICFAYNYLVDPTPYTFMGHTNLSILEISTSLLLLLYALYALLGVLSQFLAPVLAQIKYATQIISTAAISATVQATVLSLSAATAITFILPLGIILRTFYPSRKLGGLLMALAIGIYVVLPLSYVFDATLAYGFTSTIGKNMAQITITSNTIQQDAPSNAIAQGIIPDLLSFTNSILSLLSNTINLVLNEAAYLVVYAFVLPLFSVAITAISVKELAELLGSDASFLSRLNLV